MFCVDGLENSYCFIYFKCLVMFAIFTTSSTPECFVNDCNDKIRRDKLLEVEEDFTYEFNIYEIGFGCGNRSTRETD